MPNLKKKFRVTVEVEFDNTERYEELFEDAHDRINLLLIQDLLDEFESITEEVVSTAIQAGFDFDSFQFFGESVAMCGLLIPKVTSVKLVD